MPMYETIFHHVLNSNRTWIFNEDGKCIRPIDAGGILNGKIDIGGNVYYKSNGCLLYNDNLAIADEAKIRYSQLGSKQSENSYNNNTYSVKRKLDKMIGIENINDYENCHSTIKNVRFSTDTNKSQKTIKSEDQFIDESSDAAMQLLDEHLLQLENKNATYEDLIKHDVSFSDIHMNGQGYISKDKIYSDEIKKQMDKIN